MTLGTRRSSARARVAFVWCGLGQCGLRRSPRQRGAQGDSTLAVSQLCGGGHVPKHRLSRPISIAMATWSRVADGFDKTAETASHFVDALNRSPVHPVNMKANNRTMILIRVSNRDLRFLRRAFLGHYRPPRARWPVSHGTPAAPRRFA
jgi:hypothetical protein